MSKKKKNINKISETVEDVVSMQECTGLVSRGGMDDEEFESLMDLQQFSPDNIKNKNTDRKGK